MCLFFLCCCSNFETQQEKYSFDINAQTEFIKPITETIDKEFILPAIQRIIDRGSLRVAILPNDIDVFCRVTENGDFAGIDVDFAKNIAKTLGVKLEIHTIKQYSDISVLLANNTVDIGVAAYSVNYNRAASIILSEPYLSSNLCITVNSKELSKNNIKNNPIDYMKQNNVTIAVLKGSSHVITAKKAFPKAKIVELSSQNEIIDNVITDKVFAVFQGQVECINDYIKRPETMIYTKSFTLLDTHDKFCVAIAPNDLGMLNFIDAYISSSNVLNINDVESACKELYNY